MSCENGIEHNGYILSIEQIPDGEECAGLWRVKAQPVNPFGYMFYAYTKDRAETVMWNLTRGPFDPLTYSVNFSPRNAKIPWKDKTALPTVRSLDELETLHIEGIGGAGPDVPEAALKPKED